MLVDSDDVLLVQPDRNNLHSLEAITDYAMVDFMGPPYDERHVCSFYRALADPSSEDDSEVFRLQKIDPQTLAYDVAWLPYEGPRFQLLE